jgi:pimeloyl-ACP methyl ester carboxylesterase
MLTMRCLKAYLQSAAHTQLSDEALRIYMQPWQGEVGQTAFYRQIAQMDQAFTDEIEPLYAPMEIEQGVQVLWGERDEWIPIQQGHKLARLISHKPLIAVPNADHLMQEDAPESIIAAMLS